MATEPINKYTSNHTFIIINFIINNMFSYFVCRYYVSSILQFQIHRALCKATQQYDTGDQNKPLHKCDIYRQPEAGNILK